MANYDRRILIPYLQDICSAEVLCARLKRDIQTHKSKIQNLNSQINQKICDPPYPKQYETDSTNHFVYLFMWMVLPILIGIFVVSKLGNEAMLILIIAVIVAVIFGIPGIMELIEDVRKVKKLNAAAREEHERRIAFNKGLRNQIPVKQRMLAEEQIRLQVAERRLREAEKLRAEVYGVNLIANKYRNIHVAYYLYDYFSTSRESDLDKILQTMLLDEIVQRLDTVIAQNEEIILNQRMHIAMQEEQNHLAATQHREQLEAFARMERDLELQADYQNMIAKNQMVTNFILAADYMQKYR